MFLFLPSGKDDDCLGQFDRFNIISNASEFFNKIQNKIFKEQLKDYYLNCQFRRDIYVKGARAITYKQAMDRLMNTHFILTNLSKILKIKFNVP